MTTEIEKENEPLIEELIRDAEKADFAGEITATKVIHKGDDELPAPMLVSQLENAGWVYIYDTQTGERSLCLRYMLAAALKKKRPDGSLFFTTIKPKIKPKRGTLKCMLHQDDPNRSYYDSLGFPVCRKSNLASPYQVKRHMQKRHKVEWATIQEEITRKEKEEAKKERQEERKLRETLLKSVAKGKKK